MPTATVIVLAAVFLGVFGIFGLIALLLNRGRGASSTARLSPGKGEQTFLPQQQDVLSERRKRQLKKEMVARVLKPLAGITRLLGGSQSQLRQLLVHAGIRHKGAPELFLGAKTTMALALPTAVAAGLLWWWTSRDKPLNPQYLLMFCTGGIAVGLLLPNMWLRRKAKSRMQKIRLALPDALDLLVVCIEAGLGLDAALIRIARESQDVAPELSEELTLLNLEVSAGKPREECLRNLGLRTGVDEVKSLTARIVQAVKFGTNLAQSLRIHSDSLRQRRRQMAEEAGAKTTIKLIFPLVFFIFPAIFVVILGPAAVKVANTLL